MQLKRTSKKTFNEINMTPFVDVVLVLLIIFMVTAPLLEQGIKLNLPVAKGGSLDKEEEPVVISLKENEAVFINSQSVTQQNLDKRIELMFKGRKDKNIFIKADAKLPYGFVAKIISKIKQGGVEKIGLVTIPPDQQ